MTKDINKNCNFCNSCDSCDSCDSCNYCNSCNSCNSCDSCDSCNYCYSCNFCNSCDSCNYCYYCDYSSGLRMSEKMLFCLGEGKYEPKGIGYQKNYHIFNIPVSESEYNKAIGAKPSFTLYLTRWISKDKMTNEEKDNKYGWEQMGGYLKTLSYQDAWKESWAEASKEFKSWVKNLPHFNAELFEKITGVKFEETLVGSIATVEIGGKKYKAKILEE